MILSITRRIAVPRERVYRAMLDPEVLRKSIQGCEDLVRTGPDRYEVRLKIGKGLLPARFTGSVLLSDQKPPESLTISIAGRSLAASLEARARIRLLDAGGSTEFQGEGEVEVGGILGALGSQSLESTGRRLLSDFMDRLAREIELA